MRKIETEEEIEARAKKRGRYLVIFMLIILLGSTAGYAFLSFEEDSGQEGGEENYQDVNGKWVVNINGQKIYLTNSKEDVSNISVNVGTTVRDFSGKTAYIVSDSALAFSELAYPIEFYASRVQEACYGKCDKNLPEKNCTDNLIVFRQNETEMISQKDNCVFISGTLKSVDAFIYKLFE